MRFLRFLSLAIFLGCSAVSVYCANSPAKSMQAALLPQQFAGWQLQGTAQVSTDPAAADPTNALVLSEYRFTDVASAAYARDDGRTLKVRAARFADASGAFGAFTFYVLPEMVKEQIGDQGASAGQHILFYRGSVLVDAVFSTQSVMSAAELRELAGDLPKATGNTGNLPSFIQFMPRDGYVPHTQKYVMGPAALSALGAPVSGDLVDFGASAEVSLGHYNTPSGEAILMLISYPTPQLAAEHLKKLDAARQIASRQEGISAAECKNSFCDKRSGPIIAVTSGVTSDDDAKALLGKVNWEANVTWNTPAADQQVHDLYQLVLNIVVLCGIVGGLAIIAGVAFGGFRVLMKKLYPDRVFDRPEQMEFISLHLTETAMKGAAQNGSETARPTSQKPA